MAEAKKDANMKRLHALAAEMGVEIGQGDEKSSCSSDKAKSEGNASQNDAPVGLGVSSECGEFRLRSITPRG